MILDKAKMAHEMALELIKLVPDLMAYQLAERCFEYADAMQVEADKRVERGVPEVLMAVQQTFTNGVEQPRYAPFIADQKRTPKVSRFERSDAVKGVLNKAENMGLAKSKTDKEWQPDWSQAPDNCLFFCVASDGGYGFFTDIYPKLMGGDYFYVGCGGLMIENHGYKGDWRDSLRERPKGK